MRLTLALGLFILLITPGLARGQDGKILADRWYVEPLLYPEAGFQSITSEGGNLGISKLGLGIGALFHDLDEGILSGQVRGAGSVLSGGGGLGFDARLGAFWAPRLEWGGGRLGVDVFYNTFTQSVFAIPGTLGAEVPIDVILGPRNAFVVLGITPAMVANPERRVNWDEAGVFGFGHEFEWRIGGGLTLGRYGVRIVFSQRTSILTVNGIPYTATANGVSVGFSQSPYIPPAKKK